MKMLPIPLSLNGPPIGLWSDMLWRYPPAPPSPLADLKTQLPPQLPSDPRLWGREDVTVFLRFCEREYDLPKFELDLFQMNGKALCLLNRSDFGERCPGAGDVLHNVLQMLVRESQMMHRHLPSSPVTPTSRYPLSPHSHPPTPNWASLAPPESPFHNVSHLHHFMQPNSVTLSPAPSIDSQASSPPQNGSSSSSSSSSSQHQHQEQQQQLLNGAQHYSREQQQHIKNEQQHYSREQIKTEHQHQHYTNGNQQQQHQHQPKQQANGNATTTTSSSSNPSDSDEDNYSENSTNLMPTSTTNGHYHHQQQLALKQQQSPPTTPILKDMKPSLPQQIANVMNSWNTQQQHQPVHKNESVSAPSTPSYSMPVKREFFPDTPEPNTNGRLLWDFLQQLLNDPAQRYSSYIAWKCRDTGVFKIVDPAGLAKLWGIQKNHLSMNYDKMSRALRYYYRVNILRKVQGERHCYQFLRNPTELKNIKNISLLRQSVTNNTNSTQQPQSKNTQQQQQQSQQHSPGPHSPTHHFHQQQLHQNGNSAVNSNQHLGLPSPLALSQISSSSGYNNSNGVGPPPTSPHILHAIHGAFFNLSSAAAAAAAAAAQHQPPHSPVLPSTPSEKLQFSSLKIESSSNDGSGGSEEPTDLSVGERRSYGGQQNDCYPLIRNSDGLTTIKLIRYNNSETNNGAQSPSPTPTSTTTPTPIAMKQESPDICMTSISNSPPNSPRDESEDINVDDSLMPTDLSK